MNERKISLCHGEYYDSWLDKINPLGRLSTKGLDNSASNLSQHMWPKFEVHVFFITYQLSVQCANNFSSDQSQSHMIPETEISCKDTQIRLTGAGGTKGRCAQAGAVVCGKLDGLHIYI